jgi:hypothetical protein
VKGAAMAGRRIPRNILFAMIVIGVCIFSYLIVTFLLIFRSYRALKQ